VAGSRPRAQALSRRLDTDAAHAIVAHGLADRIDQRARAFRVLVWNRDDEPQRADARARRAADFRSGPPHALGHRARVLVLVELGSCRAHGWPLVGARPHVRWTVMDRARITDDRQPRARPDTRSASRCTHRLAMGDDRARRRPRMRVDLAASSMRKWLGDRG